MTTRSVSRQRSEKTRKRLADQRARASAHLLSWNIYGSETGAFLIVQGPREEEPPKNIGDLELIGNMQDLMRVAGRGYRQIELEELLAVNRYTINGYMYKYGLRPNLTEETWRQLMRMYFHPREAPYLEVEVPAEDEGDGDG